MSSEKKKIYKPSPISGFPEWLPEVRAVELAWFDHIRRVFESYGYCSIETPAVEELAVIAAKGEDVDKEIYVLDRLQADPDEKRDARLALHFDQTVPLARYVAQHFGDLVFPFKRYQMQKVWRGERPQMGRMREFYQCDIDVIHVDSLPLHFDAEVAAVMYEVVAGLPDVDLGRVQLRINNRKILMGLLAHLGIKADTGIEIARLLDKSEKVGISYVERQLAVCLDDQGKPIEKHAIKKIIDLIAIKTPDLLFMDQIKALGVDNNLMNEGVEELSFIMTQLQHLTQGSVVADLSIVRGLDYYTGTVYETALLDVPEFTGSVCSGGRYDDLAGSYINKHLPGVGISLGFSRLFDVMRQAGRLKIGAKGPADILVLLLDENQRAAAAKKAAELRKMGFNVEQYHAPQKIGKQFAYAEKKGLPFACVPMDDAANIWEIKDLQEQKQMPEAEGLEALQNRKRA